MGFKEAGTSGLKLFCAVRLSLALGGAALVLCSCSVREDGSRRGDANRVLDVGYVIVRQTSVPMITQLTGRTSAFETSDVRPQVSGIIRARLFTEGGMVRAGQTLYQIDPAPFEAAAAQARANLASAVANRDAARTRVSRLAPLARMEAVSQQDLTDAQAAARQAEAAVAQNQALLQTANINLRYTRVPAPIGGRIGRSAVTVGALVTANQADSLATIQRLDPIYVDIQQSSSDLLALRRALASGGAVPASANVRLKLEDGSDYGYVGVVQFSEVTVDPATGTVTLRARFPNPQGLLLPGMFVRATFAQAIDTTAYLVPQAAVSRDPQGNATVLIIGPGNKIVQRAVHADRVVGQNWVVTSGLSGGERVVTEGTGRVRPGQQVHPVPAGSPQRVGGAPEQPARRTRG
jgi:membrane fusion protein (multidrug efflux system)